MTEIYLRSFETMEEQSRAKGFLRHKPLRCNVVELEKYFFNLLFHITIWHTFAPLQIRQEDDLTNNLNNLKLLSLCGY